MVNLSRLLLLNARRMASLAFSALLVGANSTAAAPKAVVPLPGKPVLNLGQYDLAALGYVVEEDLLSGVATSYQSVGELTEDGSWKAAPAGSAPFTTRLVVVRPSDPAKFNGTVVVEWLNVTGGGDWAPDWSATHRALLRNGFAWVGVSVQKVGIEGTAALAFGGLKPLKVLDPKRYADLSHPGDAFAYDIYSQAGRAVRGVGGANPLGPLKVKRVLASGESQSASYLTTYINAIDPIAKVYDGFLIHSRNRTSAEIEGTYVSASARKIPKVVRFRSDLRVPVLCVITELDLTNFFPARQPDTDRLRTWEIAGASHVDVYMASATNIDSGQESMEALAAAFAPSQDMMGDHVAKPMNAAPQHHYVMNAAIVALDHWVKDERTPAHGQLIEVAPDQDSKPLASLKRDANGNAVGGIRTPWLEVPTETLSGPGNSGPPIAILIGTTEPFDSAKLKSLYPGGKIEYLKKFGASLQQSIDDGFILSDDASEIMRLAEIMYPSNAPGQ
jgi:hypothetical protein